MITVCIPTIPPRAKLLARAIASVTAQTLPPVAINVAVDVHRKGAGDTRNRALSSVSTPWVAFLDDDDELYPQHIQRCLQFAEASGADLVYPWFDVVGGDDPFPMFEGREFDPAVPNMFPVTVVARTAAMHEVLYSTGGFGPPNPSHGDDWPFWLRLIEAGVVIQHLPERTWAWHHDSGNTSGLPDRW